MTRKESAVDFIIVGCGLAGIAFAERCLLAKKSIIVIDSGVHNSSIVAAGIYNPVILKRFTGLSFAQEQLESMNNFYQTLHNKGMQHLDNKMSILRKFTSVEEQNNWFAASDKPKIAPFLSLQLYDKRHVGIDSPFNFGEVLSTGFVDTENLLKQYKNYLRKLNCLVTNDFDYQSLHILSQGLIYHDFSAKHIVFAEGMGMCNNPYFNYLPLDGTKGELIIIKSLELDISHIINSSLYIIPIGNHHFKVGATYEWHDKSNYATEFGLQELTLKLNEILVCDYEIVHHFAGIRPTVRDRKPLLGTHHTHKNIHILNGLGTRGVMLAPWCANMLYQQIENNITINSEFNITRFSTDACQS